MNRLFDSDPIGGDDPDTPRPADGTSIPHVVAPIQLLSDGLREIFSRPGMVPAVRAWKSQRQVPGELRNMQDGRVWKTMKGHDGQRFFHDGDSDKELRLGVTCSLDWYGFKPVLCQILNFCQVWT